MMGIHVIKRIVVSAIAAVAVSIGGLASAIPTQLGIAIDGSGSVSGSDFSLQVQGLTAAFAALPVDGSVEITVVQFSSTAQVEAGPVLIDSEATRDQLIADIADTNQLNGGTSIQSAINLLTSELTGSANFGGDSVINVSTDGENSAGIGVAISAAQAANDAGIDALTAEGIGNNLNINTLSQIVFGPGTNPNDGSAQILAANASPGNPLTAGVNPWVVPVTDFTAYGAVIDAKIQAIVVPPPPPPPVDVPEPGAIALLGIGILALVLVQILSRRRVNRDMNTLAFA